MRAVAILMMAGQLVGSPISAVRASARTADSLSLPAAVAGLALPVDAGSPASFASGRTAGAGTSLALALEGTPDTLRTPPSPTARFPEVAVPAPARGGYTAAYVCAALGAGLIASSFAWHDLGDRRYDEYLGETDPDRIDSRWRSTVHADQLATASLLGGEALLATAAYLRFVRRPDSRVSWRWSPARAAVAVTW